MKQLLVYVHPSKKWGSRFQREDVENLARLQVDNSLRLGWKPEDIIVATNFPWEYNGVRAGIVPDELFCTVRPLSTKTVVASWLTKDDRMLAPDEVCWVHDFDAYQAAPFSPVLTGEGFKPHVAAFPTYGWLRKWALGSYFIKPGATTLMGRLADTIREHHLEDERALVMLARQKKVGGYIMLNHTHNFGMRHLKENYGQAEKPLRVLHFHPYYKDTSLPYCTLDAFMYGKSELGFPLMDEGLIEVFKHHGIE